jgi:integrative and conjugative element protein (TIGR02256 family)
LSHMQLIFSRRKTLEFEVGQSNQLLRIGPGVLKHFKKYQQKRADSVEAGGQLFARLSLKEVVIERVTGPRRSDFRTRTLYVPDRMAEQPEIDDCHKKHLHYVGDWHTHPEANPQPSGRDWESIRESFIRSKHSLQGFLMIIVGTAGFPLGLRVSLNNAETELVLIPRPRVVFGEKKMMC